MANSGEATLRRVLVTGANKGIGRAIVETILAQHPGTFVLMGARDRGRADAVRTELLNAHPEWTERLEVLELDVASDASVSTAAKAVRERFAGEATPLYGIINNAGVGSRGRSRRDVLEVNTLGMRRVCEAFVPMLRPDGGRVVNVTSASGPSFVSRCSPERQRFFLDASLSWDRLSAFIDECSRAEGPEAFSTLGLDDGEPYGLSKACANTYTLLLAREHPGLHVNACTPGFIATDMTRHYAESAGKTPEQMGMKPPAAGARTPVHLLFAELEGNGRYYGSDAQRSPLDRYRDPGTPPYTGD